jgi:starch synthase
MAASEVVGFAKTGGLADVAGTLPSALNRRGLACDVIMPLYNSARQGAPRPEPTDIVLSVPVGYKNVEGRLWRSSLPDGVTLWLVEADQYFGRDDPSRGMGPYQHTVPDGTRYDYADNCERFVFFNRAVGEAVQRLPHWPDVVHVHDWQTGLVPVYISEVYRGRDERFRRVKTAITIHNIAFQGTFPSWDMQLTDLPAHLYNPGGVEYHNRLSFLKAGIVFSDRITTVSPTYAQEIQTPAFGRGMEGLLRANKHRLVGICNGADYSIWSPEIDRHIAARYSADDLSGKAECKRALQSEMGLEEHGERPLFAVVARLTEQKGVGLVCQVAPGMLDKGWQLVLLGEGDKQYHEQLDGLHKRYPRQMGLRLGFDEPLAHRIEAGADLFLMPSSFEPSGLNQLYSLRYGTPPVVRATGGLADTVTDTTPQTLADGTATGFSFGPYHAHQLWLTIERAEGLYRDYKGLFQQVMLNGMRQDWSWDRSAAEYEKMYREMLGRQA